LRSESISSCIGSLSVNAIHEIEIKLGQVDAEVFQKNNVRVRLRSPWWRAGGSVQADYARTVARMPLSREGEHGVHRSIFSTRVAMIKGHGKPLTEFFVVFKVRWMCRCCKNGLLRTEAQQRNSVQLPLAHD
jgi:hypothetical protein